MMEQGGKGESRAALHRRARGAVLALIAGAVAALSTFAAAALGPNETARVLAGLQPVPATLDQSTRTASLAFVREGSLRWDEYDRRFGRPMQAWSRAELGSAPGETVFYPFSGPDFPTVNQLYPGARRYVLVAIQQAGPVPALDRYSPQELGAFFTMFGRSWAQFARSGFFRTNDLEADASQSRVRVGVTGPLMAFAARAGYEVTAVEPVRITADGSDLEPHPGSRAEPGTWDSVRLRLARDGREVLLDYVRMDISDTALKKDRASGAWVERIAGNPTVLKAASHLPQKPYFSVLRTAVLNNAPSVWQDETGIEYAKLADAFSVTLYGRFTKPHRLFSPDSQSSLATAYRTATDTKPLPFRVGYEKEAGSNVQFAVRVTAGATTARAAPTAPAANPPADREWLALQARVAAQLAEYARRPRKLYLTGSPTEPVHAQYVASVRSHLTRLLIASGVAPGRAAILTLTLAGDGTLRATDIARSSGSAAFDHRVRAVVRQGEPFPQWPEAIRERADLLIVTLHIPET